uniref:Putative nuclease harbi1 n=1 Tax=Xenopsylla cheopis TaxID=163159 RepID=A0A6M2DUE2_XENCH
MCILLGINMIFKICDSEELVLFANARYPGSTHDAAIWQISKVREHLTMNAGGSYILGDSGYPLEPWLLTPYRNPANDIEERYNTMHKRARNVIERTFGIIKSRFRCLLRHRVLHYDPAAAGKIIYAVLTLHNMCKKQNIPLDQDETVEVEVDTDDAEEGIFIIYYTFIVAHT